MQAIQQLGNSLVSLSTPISFDKNMFWGFAFYTPEFMDEVSMFIYLGGKVDRFPFFLA